MFWGTSQSNPNVSEWDVSSVTDVRGMPGMFFRFSRGATGAMHTNY